MTDVIRSGLPYSKELLPQIYEKGGIVDLSKVNFPKCKTLEEQMSTAITYLRNTEGFKVKLDFSEMNYEQKSALLLAYINTKVAYDIPELDTTWLAILYACATIKYDEGYSILDDLNLQCFIAENRGLLIKLGYFIISLPIFLISRMDADIALTNIEQTDEEVELTNFINVIKHEDFDNLMMYKDEKHKPKFYKKIFTLENTELFEAISTSSFACILMGIMSEDPEKFIDFLKRITFSETNEAEECTI